MEAADGEVPESGIGATLAKARSDRGMSVEDVSARTRIRATLIRQIENDDFGGCGGAVYARGHIRGIARAVGADDGPLIAEFDRRRGVDQRPVAPSLRIDRDPIAARDLRARRGPRWVPAMVASLVVVFLLALVALLSGKGNGSDDGNKQAVAAAPSPSAARHTPAPSPTTPAPVAFTGVNVRVTVKGNPSWLSVRDDAHRLLLQQVLQPGDVKDFKAAKEIRLVLGNSGSVTMTCNGHDFGSPGSEGQVSDVTFGLSQAGDCTAG